MPHHAIHRFEIPVVELDRARRLLGFTGQAVDGPGRRIGPHSPQA